MINCLETILQHLWQPLKLETAFTQNFCILDLFWFLHTFGWFSGEDQAVHGGSSGRMRRPIFLTPPRSLASPPQEKAGAQVPETSTF